MSEAHDPRTRTMGLAEGLVRTARPRQWLKNGLVFAAPAAGGLLDDGVAMRHAVVTFVAFCLGASGLYFINDARDVEEDRLHPRKSRRPVAAGAVPVRLAAVLGVVAVAGALALAGLATNADTFLVLALYLGESILYTLWLKHEFVLDIALVATGFLLRAIAGGVATGANPSKWFLLAVSFGSLFVIAGKRLSEFVVLGEDRGDHRRALRGYSEQSLRSIVTMAATALLLTYCLWAFEQSEIAGHPILHQITIAPFLVAVLRYLVDVCAGNAGAPEEALLRDPVVLVSGTAWVALYLAAVYT